MGELACKVADCPGVDVALVPLLKNREIGAPCLPILTPLPAMAGEEICRGRQHVRGTAQQIAPAIGVEILSDVVITVEVETGVAQPASSATITL